MKSNKIASRVASRFVQSSGYDPGVVVTITRRGVEVDVALKKLGGEWFPMSILDRDGNEHYLSDAEMDRVVREAERKVKPKGRSASSRTARELDTLWLVTDPTEHSEIIDLVAGISDWNSLRNILIGSHDWRTSNPSFHDDLRSAKADAMGRLSRFYAGAIPSWVLESGKRHDFRMASRFVRASGPAMADALYELQAALESLEDAHFMLTSRHGGPSLADDLSQAREAADFLKGISDPLDRHIKALRRI